MLQLDYLVLFSDPSPFSYPPTYPDTTCDCIESTRRVSVVITAIGIEGQLRIQMLK